MDENKSGLYIVAIVGVIAVVALVVLVLGATVNTSTSKADSTGQVYTVSSGICMGGKVESPTGCFQKCFNNGQNCAEISKPFCWSICYNSCCFELIDSSVGKTVRPGDNRQT